MQLYIFVSIKNTSDTVYADWIKCLQKPTKMCLSGMTNAHSGQFNMENDIIISERGGIAANGKSILYTKI
jgi:hypothetical protein